MNATSLSAAEALLIAAAETVDVPTLAAGASATVQTGGAARLATAEAGSGALSISAGSIEAVKLIAGDALMLSTSGPIALGSAVAGADLSIRSTTGAVLAETVESGGSARIAATAVTLNRLKSAGLTEIDAAGALQVTEIAAGGDLSLASTQAGIAFGALSSDGSASLSAANSIDGEGIVAADTLVLQAGRSGVGSIAIGRGAALNASVAADDIRLGRFGAGNSITILGTRVAADIVQLPGGGGLPLALDISGLRAAVADAVDLAIDARSVRIGGFAALDSRLATTANDLRIAKANVPGAMTLLTPVMTVFTNNRSLAPVTGYDVQLYPKSRPFYLTVNGAKLATDAFIINFDSDVVDIPPSFGSSLARDMARLGNLVSSGPSFGEIARSFVLGGDGRWHSQSGDPATTAGIGAASKPLVNLDGYENQP